MKITYEMVERAARAICVEGGFDPNERMPNDGPRWKYYAPNARAALTAALAVQTQQGVEVKALEWEDNANFSIARTTFGDYTVHCDGSWTGISPKTRNFLDDGIRRENSPASAKAAAQSDYETRIRSALVDVPAVESEPEGGGRSPSDAGAQGVK